MAPHATSPPRGNSSAGASLMRRSSDGAKPSMQSMLPTTEPDQMHDLLCVGFGPASLAIAVALHDSIELGTGRQSHAGLPKVAFLEKQPHFAWHAGMQLPGAKMQISWIKDLATLRSPRSQFTFLNYLHSAGRLVQFSNIGTFTPLRVEYEAYMKWAAGWFEHLVSYNQQGIEVVPQKVVKGGSSSAASSQIDHFLVRSKNLSSGAVEERRAKHVVIATGGQGAIPANLPQSDPRVIHSSAYMSSIERVLPSPAAGERSGSSAPYRVAVLGAGQSAAEIFHNLHSRLPAGAETRLLIRGAALRPSDDSPFVNETFDPAHVDDVYYAAGGAATRAADIAADKATNYGVVRLGLLEEIYADLYEQRVRDPDMPDDQLRQQILPFREVVSVEDLGQKGDGRLRLHVQNASGAHRARLSDGGSGKSVVNESLDVDAVIVAAGYRRDAHEGLLAGARSLMRGGDAKDRKWAVGRDYRVEFEPGLVKDDAGVWLQGCNESTHGLSDTLLSILSIRGGEIVDSIFG